MKLPTLTQPFSDGIVDIYYVGNIAASGNMPKGGITLKVGLLRYEERTVGMSRFYTALQNQAKISQIIRVPRINFVSIHDIAIINSNQYDIVQIQYIQDIEPKCMDLSLQRLEVAYEFN